MTYGERQDNVWIPNIGVMSREEAERQGYLSDDGGGIGSEPREVVLSMDTPEGVRDNFLIEHTWEDFYQAVNWAKNHPTKSFELDTAMGLYTALLDWLSVDPEGRTSVLAGTDKLGANVPNLLGPNIPMNTGTALAGPTAGDNTYSGLLKRIAYLEGQLGVTSKAPQLVMNREDSISSAIKSAAKEWISDHKNEYKIAGISTWTGTKNMENDLRLYLMSEGFSSAVSASLNVDKLAVQKTASMMLAAGASALVMSLTGSFPLGAAAYFGVQTAFTTDRTTGRDLFNGVEGSGGGTIDGYPVSQMAVDIPYGLPNEVFAEYRYICYDRVSGRWYPSDEFIPLNYDSNEEVRWFILDRMSGNTYKANKIKKPRIYLD